MELASFNCLVCDLLKEIDTEATPVEGDYPTGLWWYCGHLDRNEAQPRKVFNSEVQWSRRLAEVLRLRGFECQAECRYPGESRQRCDVVVNLASATRLWMEIKGAWRAKFDPPAPNSSYHKHLVLAVEDVDKLESLTNKDASGVAMILVGFDQLELPITEEHVNLIRAKTKHDAWVESTADWLTDGRVKFRTRLWIWSRWITRAKRK
jgi:hypothetical protein